MITTRIYSGLDRGKVASCYGTGVPREDMEGTAEREYEERR
jgi:hypothetical protein